MSDRVSALRQIAQADNVRFVLDLEFVELLAMPKYLFSLATDEKNRYMTNPQFINYIEYLQVCGIN